jgi:hypothetical protein
LALFCRELAFSFSEGGKTAGKSFSLIAEKLFLSLSLSLFGAVSS